MKKQKWICAFLAAWLVIGSFAPGEVRAEERNQEATAESAAEEHTEQNETEGLRVEEQALALGESSVSYPVVKGMADSALMETVNNRILEDLGVTGYLARMSQLISSGSMKVTWRGGLPGEDIFSAAAAAEGAVVNSRSTFVWTAANVDLKDGHEIGPEELFTDAAAAREGIEAYLEENVAPEMSAHLMNGNATPLPETFYITPRGPVFLYGIDAWQTLSDRAGDLMLGWNEIQEWLNLEEGSLCARLGVREMLEMTEKSLPALQEITETGSISGLPVKIGDSVKDAVDRWKLLIDPDIYEEGRMFSLEGALFRNVFLLTDYLTESWDSSVVRGIRLDSGCLAGLRIGQTQRDEWRACLGEPANTVELDEEKAEAYRTVAGTRDYYAWGGHRLVLHSDAEGTLRSIILSE